MLLSFLLTNLQKNISKKSVASPEPKQLWKINDTKHSLLKLKIKSAARRKTAL